ncbi:hypothetical protein PYX08_03560 [Citrobacter freundii]|nr:hypothetical protein [Citrobacter freundii]
MKGGIDTAPSASAQHQQQSARSLSDGRITDVERKLRQFVLLA